MPAATTALSAPLRPPGGRPARPRAGTPLTRSFVPVPRGRARSSERPAPAPAPSGPPTCSKCASARLTRISMGLTDGRTVTLSSCRECEHRDWWDAAGGRIPLADVLGGARRPR